jgi:hypothetical protein
MSAIDDPEATERRPATWDLLAKRPFEKQTTVGDLTVTADDLLAVTPVMLERASSDRPLDSRQATVGIESAPAWTSSSGGSPRHKKNRPPWLGAGSPIEPLRTKPVTSSELLTWPSGRCR